MFSSKRLKRLHFVKQAVQRPNSLLGAALLLLSSCLLIAACQERSTEITPTLLPSATLVSLRTPGTPMTLPPTWTPIPSNTRSRTPTPTLTATITLTPAPTETLSAAAICNRWELTSQPEEGVSIAYDGFLSFLWAEGLPPDAQVIFGFTQRSQSTEDLLLAFPAGQLGTVVDITLLQRWGEFSWQASVFLDPYGELCPISGTFYREPWWNQPIPNPLSPPFAYN